MISFYNKTSKLQIILKKEDVLKFKQINICASLFNILEPENSIPQKWKEVISRKNYLEEMSEKLFEKCSKKE